MLEAETERKLSLSPDSSAAGGANKALPPCTRRHRLSRALTAWHASDGSARLLLAPWAGVFEPADWEALLARSILPKLAQSLQTVRPLAALHCCSVRRWLRA